MIPSVRARSPNAASASSSVAPTYSARPMSRRNACSGPTPGIVEPGRDRVRVGDLPVLVGEDRRARAVQDARRVRCRATRRPPPRRRRAARPSSSTKPWKIPIAFEPPPTHATTASGRRPSTASSCSRASRPITDCSSRDELGIRRGPDARADQVVRRLDVRDPVADRLARRLLQRLRAEVDAPHLGAEEAACARRWASAGACPPRPCRRRTRSRSARRRSPSRRRAGRRRSRRRCASCRAAARAPPARARC